MRAIRAWLYDIREGWRAGVIAYREQRSAREAYRQKRAEWQACAFTGHHWKHDASVAHHPGLGGRELMLCWRCTDCGCFEWSELEPDFNYYRDPQHLLPFGA